MSRRGSGLNDAPEDLLVTMIQGQGANGETATITISPRTKGSLNSLQSDW